METIGFRNSWYGQIHVLKFSLCFLLNQYLPSKNDLFPNQYLLVTATTPGVSFVCHGCEHLSSQLEFNLIPQLVNWVRK